MIVSKQCKKLAKQLDKTDPLKKLRKKFSLPKKKIYLCNNSLGLMPKHAKKLTDKLLFQWKSFGAQGWFAKQSNWYSSFDQPVKEALANLLGAFADEVCVMNSLTVNLHLLLVSFYQPNAKRYKIVVEAPIFPSDIYAIKSHLRFHGFDPEKSLIIVEPKENQYSVNEEDVLETLEKHKHEIALCFFSVVNFHTGSVLDVSKITKKAKEIGSVVGLDLAHAAGNISLNLHEDQVDFAVGCSYKYLCGGPGSPGIAFVHAKHHDKDLPRFSGWWGNDPNSRFQKLLERDFIPFGGASSWQVSTPSVLSLMPVYSFLKLFQKVGMKQLREKSVKQTKFLHQLLKPNEHLGFKIVTPEEPDKKGCQISILLENEGKKVVEELLNHHVICDFRAPNILRVTPSAFYTSYKEIYQFASVFLRVLLQKK